MNGRTLGYVTISGRILGLASTISIIVVWLRVIATGPAAGDAFFVLAWIMIGASAVGLVASLLGRADVMLGAFFLLLPLAIYFLLGEGNLYRTISYLTFLFLIASGAVALGVPSKPRSEPAK